MMGQLQRNGSAQPQFNFGSNMPVPNAYAGIGVNDYMQSLVAAPQNIPFSGMPSMSSISPQQLALASGMPMAPTISGNTGGMNFGFLNPTESTVGNPTGLTLGAGAGGLPKIAMTDKINAGVGVFNAALGAVSAYKALKLGKENLNFQKESFYKNFEATKNTTNAQLENAQRVRVSADPAHAMSVADYMAKYGVK